ncbi:hypothetical protein ACTVQY_26380, partial [Klebsiella pneumoniae]
QIREILISESAWEEMTCLFAPSLAAIKIRPPYYLLRWLTPRLRVSLPLSPSHLGQSRLRLSMPLTTRIPLPFY